MKATLSVLCLLLMAAGAAGAERPNILYCVADDWGWPHAGAYGDKVVKTPTFDRLAKEGVLFTHCFSAAPSCSPSRAAMLTGQYPHRLEEGDEAGIETVGDLVDTIRRKRGDPGADARSQIVDSVGVAHVPHIARIEKYYPFKLDFGRNGKYRLKIEEQFFISANNLPVGGPGAHRVGFKSSQRVNSPQPVSFLQRNHPPLIGIRTFRDTDISGVRKIDKSCGVGSTST